MTFFSCKKSQPLVHVPFTTAMKQQFDADIDQAIAHIDSMQKNSPSDSIHFIKSRAFFKKIEPILATVDTDNYAYLNQPNILKVEEEDPTNIRITNPSGYQVLEEHLFAEDRDTSIIKTHLHLIKSRLQLVKKNTSLQHLKKYHVLWMFRKQIIKVAITGITGFDSPVLENSIQESKVTYQSILRYFELFDDAFNNPVLKEKWYAELNATIEDLTGDFASFDRYAFTKNHTHTQLKLWNEIVQDWGVTFPFELAFKNDATSLYSPTTFNINYFIDQRPIPTTEAQVALGKKLFYDTNLSRSQQMSCATCHQPEKAFTDGLRIAEHQTRNSPTLLYAALQKGFFYDKRAGGLEAQISNVVKNKHEFHTDLTMLETTVRNDSSYNKLFTAAYPRKEVTHAYIRNAIAHYVRSLTPFSSKFDRNINGIENTLTQSEINGYNLFNGKAKCATCHFAPLFNGTVPPDYKESELEAIGVPIAKDTIHATVSNDLGRYYVYQTPERKHFFKTPTIRNASKTAPYMHNGVYNTLEEVIDFYNRGGGAGIGIELSYQTLPPDPLGLNKEEINDLIKFIKSLEDKDLGY